MPGKRKHYPDCPAAQDEQATCLCETIEDRTVSATSRTRPSPADLIRKARESGLIKSGQPYP